MYKYFIAYKTETFTGNCIIKLNETIKTIDDIRELQNYISKDQVKGEKAIIINYILIKD
jgi:hypothetical protein